MTAQFAVRAENGKTAYSSEEVARRAAVEGGWTLNDSPIVAALTRDDETAEWRDLDVRSSPGRTGGDS
jgi:hypothetical protein